MKKLLFVFIIAILLVGCSNKFENEDIVAIVGDKEITVADVRLFYNLDKTELSEAVKSYVKEEIMVQQAKKLKLDVSEEIEEQREMNSPFPLEQTKEQKEFAQKEAKALGMTEEEYYQTYLELSTERSAYIMAFIEVEVGEITKEVSAEDYAKKVDRFIDGLLEEYSGEIEILVEI